MTGKHEFLDRVDNIFSREKANILKTNLDLLEEGSINKFREYDPTKRIFYCVSLRGKEVVAKIRGNGYSKVYKWKRDEPDPPLIEIYELRVREGL